MRLVQLWRYPVKSMQGEAVPRAALARLGVVGDRQRGVRDARTRRVLTAKRCPELLGASAALVDGDLVLTLPDGRRLDGEARGVHDELSGWLGRDVRLDHARYGERAVYEADVGTLIGPAGSFVDGRPLHLLTTATLRAIGEDVRRYRPNLVVDVEGEAHVEDSWVGSTLRLGTAELSVIKPTRRCVLVTQPQPGLPARPEALDDLRSRGLCLGVYLAPTGPGELRVEDAGSIA